MGGVSGSGEPLNPSLTVLTFFGTNYSELVCELFEAVKGLTCDAPVHIIATNLHCIAPRDTYRLKVWQPSTTTSCRSSVNLKSRRGQHRYRRAFLFPSHQSSWSYFSSSLHFVTQIRGHVADTSPPSPLRCMPYFLRGSCGARISMCLFASFFQNETLF